MVHGRMKVLRVFNSSLQLFWFQLFHWTWIVTLGILMKIMTNMSSKSRFLLCNGRSRGTTAYHQTGMIHEDMLDMAFHTASGVYETSWSEKGGPRLIPTKVKVLSPGSYTLLLPCAVAYAYKNREKRL
ncbi:hypothetical protein Hdeb2414_s0002g00061161 [Helianthus debilis subsp. tardiflorus]